jgi:hypothetical protein
MEPKQSISISKKLFEVIKKRLDNSINEFNSVDDYVEYVLKELLSDDSSPYTEEEEQKVEKHLKDMGYI